MWAEVGTMRGGVGKRSETMRRSALRQRPVGWSRRLHGIDSIFFTTGKYLTYLGQIKRQLFGKS